MMKYYLTLVLIIPLFLTCKKENNSKIIIPQDVLIYKYDSLCIPNFFNQLVVNHSKEFSKIYEKEYTKFCNKYKVNKNDSLNLHKFLTLRILHNIFTSKGASNGSKGEVINIPYFWHWSTPNPRYQIRFVETNKLLTETKPPNEFSKYKSFADIDRTPFLFLSDLVSLHPKYYSPLCDTFSTFGWCSEREMAFVALTGIMGYKGKVIAEGNHSWTEIILDCSAIDAEEKNIWFRIDNTFDIVEWKNIDSEEIKVWGNFTGDSKMEKWYNKKADSNLERDRIKNYIVAPVAAERIELSIVHFIRKELA